MSIAIRDTASTLASATATTSTITVNGRRMAKTIGFMSSIQSRGDLAVKPADQETAMREIILASRASRPPRLTLSNDLLR
jgi:hypothetical protein